MEGGPLRSEPPSGIGARGRCWRPDPSRNTDGVDHTSRLPDDLLLQVLVRLRCTRAAAHTSLISRRWRGLWRHLPELYFRDLTPGALDTALSQVAREELCLLDINSPDQYRYKYSAAGVAKLLRTAALLAPVVLSIVVSSYILERHIPVELPIFDRTTSIKMSVQNSYLVPPAQGGNFTVLEELSISGCCVDNVYLVSHCPRLRVLEICRCWGLDIISVHSETIEELVVDGNEQIGGIDIVAPVLKKFTMCANMKEDFNVSFFAPIVEDLYWYCLCDFTNVCINEMWFLHDLDLWMEESICGLDLSIKITHLPPISHRDLMNQIAQLPKFSVLTLHLVTLGHVFGGMVVNLLGICTTIQRLNLMFAPPLIQMTSSSPHLVSAGNRKAGEIRIFP